MTGLRWISVDPSCRCSGVAVWQGDALMGTHAIKPSLDSLEWPRLIADTMPRLLVYEAAAQGGKGYQTAVMLERHRGDIRRWCALGGCPEEVAVGVQEWRTVLGVKGPGRDVKGSTARTGAWKAAAREAVRLRVMAGELTVEALQGGSDEIDAVCIGLAWLRMAQ
jgi:hypothetical protein